MEARNEPQQVVGEGVEKLDNARDLDYFSYHKIYPFYVVAQLDTRLTIATQHHRQGIRYPCIEPVVYISIRFIADETILGFISQRSYPVPPNDRVGMIKRGLLGGIEPRLSCIEGEPFSQTTNRRPSKTA